MKQARSGIVRAAKGVAVALALGALLTTLAKADLGRVVALVGHAGGWVALGLVPYAFAVLADGAAWRVLGGGIARLPLLALARLRLRCDAFGATLPGGTTLADSMAPVWLRRWVPIETGVALVAGRKCFVGLAQAAYLLASFAVGFSPLRARTPALPWVVLALGVAMLVLFAGTSLALASGSVAARIHAALAALPFAPVKKWIASRGRDFQAADERLRSLFRASPRRLATATALFFVCWSLEAVETWALLRLLGAPLSFGAVFAFEASVSLLRSLACFAPGGLGVQDLGYVAALGAVGVPDAVTTGAAFVVLKRAKELLWALAGYASLVSPRGVVAREGASAGRSFSTLPFGSR